MAKIGLALAGGGARGAYQIGAWKAFRETGLDKCISAYSGASVGSLNAALFAMDDYETAHKMWMKLNKNSLFNIEKKIYKRVFKEKLKFLDKGVFDTKDLEKLIDEAIDFDKVRKRDVFVATTHLGNEKSTFFDLLKTNYKHYFRSEKQTNYQKLNDLSDEDIKKTLLASCAIPIVFKPIEIDNKTFYDGGIDEVIATRRLVHISNAFAIFGDRMKAIEMCVNRFDEDTKTSFLDLYSKIDAEAVIPSDENESEETVSEDSGYASENTENNPF